MSDIDKAREECKRAMTKVPEIEDGELRGVFELHLQHIHAALGGEKADLYELVYQDAE